MTPDGNPLLGPLPGVRGFWVAAGLSLNGFGGAGGHRQGPGGVDDRAARPSSTSPATAPGASARVYRDPAFADEAAREVYRYYYRLRYPLDTDEWGRPRRLSPLHGRLQELGAVFGVKNGWERADYFEPGRAVAAGGRGPARVRLDARRRGSRPSRRSTRRSASGSGSST